MQSKMSLLFKIALLVALIGSSYAWNMKLVRIRAVKGILAVGLAMGTPFILPVSQSSYIAHAKEELPSLERCFAAVRKELDPQQGESLARLKKDIDTGNWADLKLFTREYDAGFRGGVLKKSWKQLGDRKADGIRISNSFTFDLIGMNQAARKEDTTEALKMLDAIRHDIEDFAELE